MVQGGQVQKGWDGLKPVVCVRRNFRITVNELRGKVVLDQSLHAKVIQALDPEKFEQLQDFMSSWEELCKNARNGVFEDSDKEEWSRLSEQLDLVAAEMFPDMWPNSRGISKAAAESRLAIAHIEEQIAALEIKQTCSSCHQDFQNVDGKSAVALPCGIQEHFMCSACVKLQEDSFPCPSCRQATLHERHTNQSIHMTL
jgi:hypothetical protein